MRWLAAGTFLVAFLLVAWLAVAVALVDDSPQAGWTVAGIGLYLAGKGYFLLRRRPTP